VQVPYFDNMEDALEAGRLYLEQKLTEWILTENSGQELITIVRKAYKSTYLSRVPVPTYSVQSRTNQSNIH
jgi:hypothetical protein